MKFGKFLFICFLTLFTEPLLAQNPDREISEETAQKRYEMYVDGELVKKSVKIHTVIRQEIRFDTVVENKIDANRIKTPKEVTKTIDIDNDADEAIDETIKFRYTSDAAKAFLLNTNDNEIFTAIENSKYLNVKDKKDMSEENLNTMFVITDTQGNAIELILEEYDAVE